MIVRKIIQTWVVAFNGVILQYPEKEKSQVVLLRNNSSVYYLTGL